MNYTDIFRKYRTSENKLFYLLNKRVAFPDDLTLPIYDKILVTDDIAWTVLSYKLYETIDYWWVLCNINPLSIFYAKSGSEIYYIKPEYLDYIIANIKENAR